MLTFLAGTFCGVFRRQALDRGAILLNVDKIVTGSNTIFDFYFKLTEKYVLFYWYDLFYTSVFKIMTTFFTF